MTKTVSGEEALARGALSAGVNLVTGYPGSPSSGAFESFLPLADRHGLDIEWSSNERVALEVAIGASIAGNRALVCVKSVGMNVMLDTMMALNLTPVNGGLVILLGDDPGGYGSQNDQDTRPLATMMEMPMIEPTTPHEAYQVVRDAYDLSEKENTVVIVRITRSFGQSRSDVDFEEETIAGGGSGFTEEEYRFVPVPINVVAKHRELHRRVDGLQTWSDKSTNNHIEGTGKIGIVGAGFAYEKLMEAGGSELFKHARVFKLSTLFPLPESLLTKFLLSVDEVLILEETEPYLENQICSIAHRNQIRVRVRGSLDHTISRTGELFRWEIQNALIHLLPQLPLPNSFSQETEQDEWPTNKNHCENCRYDELLDVLERTAEKEGLMSLFVADPGCFVSVANRLTAKYSIGSAVAVADGMVRSKVNGFPIAILGDSGFFHSSIPAICNATHNNRNLMIIVADNRTALASGGQSHPGSSTDARGREARELNIEEIGKACGVDHISTVNLDDEEEKVSDTLTKAYGESGVRLVRVLID